MRIYLQENANANELGLIGFKKGEMKYLCLFDIHLDVYSILGYVDMGNFFDFRVIETKRGFGNKILEISINAIYPSYFVFDREVNINDYGLKYIKEVFNRTDMEKKQIPKESEWYREYGNKDKEFYVNHFFKLKMPTTDIFKLKEIGDNIINRHQDEIPDRMVVIKNLYHQAIEGKIRV